MARRAIVFPKKQQPRQTVGEQPSAHFPGLACLLLAVGFLVSLEALLLAAPGPKPSPAEPVRRWTSNDAVIAAVLDIANVPVADRIWTRYVWTDDLPNVRVASLTTNLTSRSPSIEQIKPLYQGRMCRVNLRKLADEGKDLTEFVETWEQLQFDPRFNLLITEDTIKFAVLLGIDVGELPPKKFEDMLVDCPPYTVNGVTYSKKWIKKPVGGSIQLVRKVAPHIDRAAIARLIDETRSQAPVVWHQYLVYRALSQIQGDGIYKTIYGGLYYRFNGIKSGFQKGTDLDNFYEQHLGIGTVKANKTAKQIFDELQSDKRIAIFFSNVTGAPRTVAVHPSLAGNDVGSTVGITSDAGYRNIDIGSHPLANLLNVKSKAHEIIYPRRNGLIGGALFSAEDGKLQDSVPEDVAVNHTIPAPWPKILQPMIGCIDCHGPHDGWQPLTNDVTALMKRFKILNDMSEKDKPIGALINRAYGLYRGDLEVRTLPRARDDQAAKFLEASGPWPDKDMARAAGDGCAAITGVYRDYWYARIDAKRAVAELGLRGDLEDLLALPAEVEGELIEDIRIGGLLMGKKIVRADFDLVYSFLAARAMK